jgi:O-antigen ligase
MRKYLEKLDDFADIKSENSFAKFLERTAFVFMILMFVFAPHSIAGTQIAWLTGMFAWLVRQFVKPRPMRRTIRRTSLDIALWVFFAWSVISSIFSYDPLTSLDKLRNVTLFLIFYYIVNVLRSKRAVIFMASVLITSAMVSVVWTPIERVFGRGVEIVGVRADSPFAKALLMNGDTLLKANGKKIKTPDDLLAEIEANETTDVFFYRPDFYLTVQIKRENLLRGDDGATALEQLGIADWKRSRNWRSTGFYSHYVTFAEVLQLIASLAFGLFIAALGARLQRQRQMTLREESANYSPAATRNFAPLILTVCVGAMALALLLTVTRASQIGFLISAFSIVFFGASRKILLILVAVALPVALLGVYFQQQSRQVGYFDSKDESTRDRETFYRKGFDLWTKSARNLLLGVGMDSTKRYVNEWNLFDNQGKPMGHFHSTPLQLLVERGLPGLLLWLWVLWVYGRTLMRHLKFQTSSNADLDPENPKPSLDWRETGIVLGSLGGLIGFFTSGLVHFNLGDAEVVMVFFMLMGLSVALVNQNLRFRIQN